MNYKIYFRYHGTNESISDRNFTTHIKRKCMIYEIKMSFTVITQREIAQHIVGVRIRTQGPGIRCSTPLSYHLFLMKGPLMTIICYPFWIKESLAYNNNINQKIIIHLPSKNKIIIHLKSNINRLKFSISMQHNLQTLVPMHLMPPVHV